MDTSGNDAEAVAAMVAEGAQLALFTTGRGIPLGNPIAPVLKVASNSETFAYLCEDMGLDAGGLSSGRSVAGVGKRLFKLMLRIVSGKSTATERWGHKEFASEPLEPRV